MVAQGVLGFQYEAEGSSAGLTSLAGLPLYLDLVNPSLTLSAPFPVTISEVRCKQPSWDPESPM